MSTPTVLRRTLVAALLLVAVPAEAQLSLPLPRADVPHANGEWERYARALQLVGRVPLRPWSIRAFGPRELAALQPSDTSHPWARRLPPVQPRGRAYVGVVPPGAHLVYNSAYPFGYNDEAVWAGRGVTAALTGGVVAGAGPLSITVAPTWFVAQNEAFALMPNGLDGSASFRDARWGHAIDRPQRFGDGRYSRLEWGQSSVRVDVLGVAAGISTANQFWGPAAEHPIILGNNAAGFAHLFAGTSKPADVWMGQVHGRLVWGRLEQSEYSAADDSGAVRFAPGLVGTFTPRGLPGLELGAARFFHVRWPSNGLTVAALLKPLEGVLKQDLATATNESGDNPGDNQLASVFARWVFPRAGLEVYGEYGREDHNQDGRDLALQPDHDAAYLLGVQRAWSRASHILVGRAEVLNSRFSHLQQVRGQAPLYVHSRLRQGHTHRGQVLGSTGGLGGGAAVLAADLYHPGGRWSVSWSRVMRGEFRQGGEGNLPDPDRADVIHALSAETLLFRPGMELLTGVTAVQNFNRDHSGDAFNLNLRLGARAHW